MKKILTRKIVALFLSLTLTVSLLPVIPVAASTFAGGTGTSAAPYLISTKDQLDFMRDKINSNETDTANSNTPYASLCYKLTQDIDLSSEAWVPIRSFAGTFDGGGFTLSNYSISTTNGVDINQAPICASGLFGVIEATGTVENLGVSGTSNLAYTGVNPPHYTGGVAAMNEGNITCCRNSGALTDNSPTSIGGIAGESSGTVTNCYNTGVIFSSGSPSHVGGILGDNDGMALQYCYNMGNLTTGSDGYAGGVAAYVTASPSTMNCFSVSQLSGDASAKLSGIAYTESSDSLSGCDFYSLAMLHLNGSDTNTPTGESSAAYFKTSGGYYTGGGTSWDFSSTWKFGADNYPALKVFDHEAPAAPVFTSGTTVSFAEDTAGSVYTAAATGSGAITYSLSGGADKSLFQINSTTGAVTFIGAPDYENPMDSDKNNVYNITVQATDSAGGSATQDVAITVTNIDDVNFSSADNDGGNPSNAIASNKITRTMNVTGGGTVSVSFSTVVEGTDSAYTHVEAANENSQGWPMGLYNYTGNNSDVKLLISVPDGYTFNLSGFKYAADKDRVSTVNIGTLANLTNYGSSTVTQTGSNGYTLVKSFTNPVHDVTSVVLSALGYVQFQDIEITNIKKTATAPATPTLQLSVASDSGESNSDGITSTTTPTFTGTADAGTTVTLFDTNGTTVLGTAVAASDGKFSITTSALSEGTHTIAAKAKSAADSSLVSSASSGVSVKVDTTAPGKPTITNASGTVNTSTPVISGTAEAGSTVKLYDGNTLLGSAAADGSGIFSFTPGSALSDGGHTITATATDAAGNVSAASSSVTITVDTTAPGKPTITNASGTVNTSTPVISGTAEAGSTVKLYDGNTLLGSATADESGIFSITPGTALSDGGHTITATATDAAGNVSASSTPVTITVDTSTAPTVTAVAVPSNGSYKASTHLDFTVSFDGSVTVTGTPRVSLTVGSSVVYADYISGSGSSNLVFRYTIAAGDNDIDGIAVGTLSLNGGTILNSTGHSVNLTLNSIGSTAGVLIDTTAPDKPVITSPSGTINTSTPAIVGTAEAGSSVKLYDNGVLFGSVTTNGSGNFSFTTGTPLSAGSHTLTATATDLAGNVSPASPVVTITIDTTVPAATGLTVTASAETPARSGIINVKVTPAAGSGNSVYYRIDNHRPAAPSVGDSLSVSAWTENTHGTAAFEISAVNGCYIEAVEVDSNGKVVKWGVSAGVNDGYSVTDSRLNLSSSSFDKSTPSDLSIPMTLNGNTLIGITKGSDTLLAGNDYIMSSSAVTLKSGFLTGLNIGSVTLVFHFSAGANQTFSISVGDTASSSGVVSAFNSLVSSVSAQSVAFGTAISKLNLPNLLSGMVDGISNSLIKVREWVSGITYNPAIAGVYDFTPILDSGFSLKDSGVALPHIRVTVAQSDNSDSHHSNSDSSQTQPASPKTETKVDSSSNSSVVTTVPDNITSNGTTAQINITVPTVTTDTTGTNASLNGGEQAHVTISLPENTILQQLDSHQNVDLTLTVPPAVAQQTDSHTAVTIPVSSKVFTAAKANGADVTLHIKDADTEKLAYTWTFKGSDLAKSTVPVSDVNISMAIRLTTEVPQVNRTTPDNKGIVLLFNHSGVLPSTANVTFSAKAKGFQPGQKMYFYYYNATTGQLESQAKEYTVDADGNVTVQINHCSDYVLLPNKAKTITLDTRSYTMRPGNSYITGVKLNGVVGAKIKAYSSTKGVAGVTVLNNGNIKAVGLNPGLTYIMIDVYDGKGNFLTHASVRLAVKYGVKPNGNSYRQYGIF